MRITCAQEKFDFSNFKSDLNVILYGQANNSNFGSIGGALKNQVARKSLVPTSRAWDFLTLALSVISADFAGSRLTSPDGWTRTLQLKVSVEDPCFWNSIKDKVEFLLAFLTTDQWELEFVGNGKVTSLVKKPIYPLEDCVCLLSGGLDSLIGAINLSAEGKLPYAVSQIITADTGKQKSFSRDIGGGLSLFQVNHNVRVPHRERPQTQRARSIIFIAYGALISSCLASYKAGNRVKLYVCENGFISINPPLTSNRIGSLSTRTTHPVILSLLQAIFDDADINVEINNPYQYKTKGEMLKECNDQLLLKKLAYASTSCGRHTANKIDGKYVHCGRCVPCIIRRSALYSWNRNADSTTYCYYDLSIQDDKHAFFDDVRSILMAIEESKNDEIQQWLGATLSSNLISNKPVLENMIKRGLSEVEEFLVAKGVR